MMVITELNSIEVAAEDLLREETDERAENSTCLVLKGIFRHIPVDILIDTGANVCAVSEELYKQLKKRRE